VVANGLVRQTALALALVLLLVTLSGTAALAYQRGTRVVLNGQELFFDVPPQIIDDRTMVPLRLVFEAMGATVTWLSGSRLIVISKDDTEVMMQVGRHWIAINNVPQYLDVPPVLFRNRTLIPIRHAAEALGATVEWEGVTRSVIINTLPEEERAGFVLAPSDAGVSTEEISILARLIGSEATGEPFEGKVAVGAVVVNRILDPYFPNTIEEIIWQPRQFQVISDQRYFRVDPILEDFEAAKEALRGTDPSYGALFFFNPRKTNDWFMHSRPVIVKIGGHSFTR